VFFAGLRSEYVIIEWVAYRKPLCIVYEVRLLQIALKPDTIRGKVPAAAVIALVAGGVAVSCLMGYV
jgi:hypothetical protein